MLKPRITFISDTHNNHEQLELLPGNILVHCGDFSNRGTLREITAFNTWLGRQPFEHKVIIAGNHDLLFEENNTLARSLITNAHYLEDSGIILEGIKFWGSPVTPWFFNWAFNRLRGEEIKKHWDMIPDDTNILITHGPPFEIKDYAHGEHLGCEDLLDKVFSLSSLKTHAFGHIHEGAGESVQNGVHFANACSVNERHEIINKQGISLTV